MRPIRRFLSKRDARKARSRSTASNRRSARLLRLVTRRAPFSAEAAAYRGLHLARIGRLRLAIRVLEQAMTLAAEEGCWDWETPPHWLAMAAYQAALAHECMGEPYLALRCYTKAMDAHPGLAADVLRRRAQLYLQLGHYNRALHDLEALTALSPQDQTRCALRRTTKTSCSRWLPWPIRRCR